MIKTLRKHQVPKEETKWAEGSFPKASKPSWFILSFNGVALNIDLDSSPHDPEQLNESNLTKEVEIGDNSSSSIYDIKLITSNKSVPKIWEMIFELLELEFKKPHNDRECSNMYLPPWVGEVDARNFCIYLPTSPPLF